MADNIINRYFFRRTDDGRENDEKFGFVGGDGRHCVGRNGCRNGGSQEPAPHFHEVNTDFMDKFHNPMEGVKMGLDVRLREIYARNIFSLNEQYGDNGIDGKGLYAGNWNNHHWQRYRTRWSTKWAIDEDIDFNTRLVWEFWGHVSPDGWHPIFG
ncbi:MAG: hypothetical protein ACYSO0_01690, partial [Planctomycetota bacterium]